MKSKIEWKKAIIIASTILILFLIAVISLYANLKNFTLNKVLMTDGQEVYLMGTFHKEHFEHYANYSIEELISAVNHIDPDVILIEAREENFLKYGVIGKSIMTLNKTQQPMIEMITFIKTS
ncbi:MAG: hypothetical protein GX567_10380 [Clostridia bacterium]|nr:hypothetical protein [Clostridia bacterium]